MWFINKEENACIVLSDTQHIALATITDLQKKNQ